MPMQFADTRNPTFPKEKPISIPEPEPKNPGYNDEDDNQKKRGPGEEGV